MIDGPTYRLSENLARQCLPNWHLAQVHRVDFDNDYFAKNPLSNRELAPIFDTFHEHRFDFYMREWGGLGADDLEAVVDALCDSVLLQRRVWPDRQPRLPVSSVMAAFSAYKKLLGWAPEVKTVLEVGPGTGLISLFMKRLPALERYSQVEACQGLYLLQGMANDLAFPYEVEEKALPQNLATAADFHLVENPLLELPCYVDMPRRPPRCVHYPWWRVGELMKQPGSVDVVMSNANLREFSQYALRDYLALFRRVLKPDGVVLAQCLGGELHRDASGLISELRDMKFAPIVFDLQGGSRWFSGPNLPLMAKSFCTSNAVLVGPEHPLFEKYNKAECFEGCHFGAEPAVLDMYFPQDGLRRLYSVAELRDLVEARLVVRLTSADPVGVRSTKRRPRATDDQPLFTSSFDPRFGWSAGFSRAPRFCLGG
ncbi:MAG: class I SAM-dependent methyltransferase [Opitutaceae bacterium]|nr:class I SAM-dependent methyltransferase [Opitutaceae bacterium]